MNANALKGMTSSKTILWGTPQTLFDELNDEFKFDCDVCACDGMEMVANHYTPEIDGLKQDWTENKSNWMNPPYGREIKHWMKKACESNANVVCLIPARTDTEWWHNYIIGKAAEIRFIKGRVKFTGGNGKDAPFPSAIVIYKKRRTVKTKMTIQERA